MYTLSHKILFLMRYIEIIEYHHGNIIHAHVIKRASDHNEPYFVSTVVNIPWFSN